ncbi:hypothetical protein TNCV_2376411 [Trichonephila clavipes]|nr:hypothetical protein TNCV_2376411 [Trichonephila clavipes]
MIPPDKSISNFAFRHYDVVKRGSYLVEPTLEQTNPSVLFLLIDQTDIGHTFQCLTKADREGYRSIGERILWIFSRKVGIRTYSPSLEDVSVARAQFAKSVIGVVSDELHGRTGTLLYFNRHKLSNKALSNRFQPEPCSKSCRGRNG